MWLGLTAARGAATDDLSLDDNRTKNSNPELLRRGDEAERKCQGSGHLAKPNVVREGWDGIIFPSEVIYSESAITGLRLCNLTALFWFLLQPCRALARGKTKLLESQETSPGGVMGWELLLELDGISSPRPATSGPRQRPPLSPEVFNQLH